MDAGTRASFRASQLWRYLHLLLRCSRLFRKEESSMNSPALPIAIVFLAGCFTVSSLAGDERKSPPADAARPSYELPQPEKETLDYAMYQRIREEAGAHSHVMEYASALMDGIGPRLTGSPNLKRANEWTRDQFVAMGCANAHLEDWGEFGMGWQQLNTWVRMTAPDMAIFIAQAAPWSPATKGAVNAPAVWVDIKEEKDFEKYKGKLAGKIVFLGEMREVKPVDKPLFSRHDSASLKEIEEFRLEKADPAFSFQAFLKSLELREKIGRFLAAEQAAGVVTPSRDGRNSGGSGGTIFDDTGAGFGWLIYQRELRARLPAAQGRRSGDDRDERGREIHRRPRARLRHHRGNSGHRPKAKGRAGDARRASGLLGVRDGRHG